MSKPTISGQEFFKSLGALQAMAKGQEEDVNKSQLFHTAASSKKEAWPGGTSKELGDNWDDSIGRDGTDYQAARKSIAEKVMKGEALTPGEVSLLKSDLDKGEGQEVGGKDKDSKECVSKAKEDEDKDKDKMDREKYFGKSLADYSETVHQGLELSPFLAEFAKSFDARLGLLQEYVDVQISKAMNGAVEQLGSYMQDRFGEQSEFNKSLATVVASIGHGMNANLAQTADLAQQPVGAPKSVQGVQAVNKSFAGQAPQGEPMSKSQVLVAMSDMVEKGKLNSLDLIKYETTGQIDPRLLQQIQANR
jgi:hypothetical protein